MRLLLTLTILLHTMIGMTQTDYQLPPKEIMELADVKSPSATLISKNNKYLLMVDRSLYKTLEELAEPEVKLAGLRINPENFDVSRGVFYNQITVQTIADGKGISLKNLPSPLKAKGLQFSPKENYISFIQVEPTTLSLWVIDLRTGEAKRLIDGLNNILGGSYTWSNDESFLYMRSKGNKAKWTDTRELPKGPATQDATGAKAAARTYQDLLRNKQDEAKFDYYVKSEMLKVGLDGKTQKVLPEAIYKRFSPSPDGKLLMAEEIKQPYSYTLTYSFFPTHLNIYDTQGGLVSKFNERALQDKLPTNFDAVEAGKRSISWRADKPSTLLWVEAPDGGDPTKESEFRDEIFMSEYPFNQPKSICLLKNRYNGVVFGRDDLAVVVDYWWKTRNSKTYFINPSVGKQAPKMVYDLNTEDVYADPGDFATTDNEYNRSVLWFSKDGKKLYLTGEGCSPEGNKPFIDEFDIATLKANRLWRADGKSTYESILRIVDLEKKTVITSIESPKVYPNYYLRNYGSKTEPKQLTFRDNPYKALKDVSKQKIHYKRADGVDLSATLYLPAGYDKTKDGRLPMLLEAYPTEYKDDKAAGQIKESPHAFISINWASPVFWVTRGFAVLEDTQFPIIGKGEEEPNDTYIEQLVADAAAAIKAVDSMGVVDPKRCAAMGHSYGAFMTVNLLTHSNLFAGGIARSGAYNRTLTPFGFQSEERNYWQAQDIYNRMSPFNYADKIKTPVLIIHGDADNNPGTFTLQSERLFQAIKGNGGLARLVLLPFESHSYAARENILHMLWEMDSWLMKYVKK